jgi:hypothetical protein
MTEDKLVKAAQGVLRVCASSSFNERHHVCPWDDSNLSKILEPLPAKVSKQLSFDAVVRAIEFRKKYGCSGSKHFGMLLKHHEKMWGEVGQKIKLSKKNYWSVVDIVAISSLIPGGQRVGNVQVSLYSKKGVQK